jgi:hypothetical protein
MAPQAACPSQGRVRGRRNYVRRDALETPAHLIRSPAGVLEARRLMIRVFSFGVLQRVPSARFDDRVL